MDPSAAGADDRSRRIQRIERRIRLISNESRVDQGLAGGFHAESRETRRIAQGLAVEKAIGHYRIVDITAHRTVDDRGIEIRGRADAAVTSQQASPKLVG